MLEVRSLTVRYGRALAVDGVSLYVAEGEAVALLGANGAGKTSTLRGILGLAPVAGGTVRVAGEEVTRRPPWERVALGVGYVPEGRRVFPRLTVEENLRAGAWRLPEREVRQGLAAVFELFPRLGERRRQLAGSLSGGEQQMLAIGRALMGRPRLLLVDEASMGLSPLMVQAVFEALDRLSRQGIALLLVEQSVRHALMLARRAYVLVRGRVVLSGDSAALKDDPRLASAYLGQAS